MLDTKLTAEIVDRLSELIQQELRCADQINHNPSADVDRDDFAYHIHGGRVEELRTIRNRLEQVACCSICKAP